MPTSTDDPQLHPSVLDLAREPNYAALTRFMPSGHAQSQMVWVDTDGEYLLVDTEVHRQKSCTVEIEMRFSNPLPPAAQACRVRVQNQAVRALWRPRSRATLRPRGAASGRVLSGGHLVEPLSLTGQIDAVDRLVALVGRGEISLKRDDAREPAERTGRRYAPCDKVSSGRIEDRVHP